MKFEYVLSGLKMCRVNAGAFMSAPENVEAVQKSLDAVNAKGDYYISGLFNAYVEPISGRQIHELYRKHFKNVHGDSGGLQVITCGLEITPELKTQVYEIQGLYSDVAMCFDEIPLTVFETSNASKRTSIDNKLFSVPEMEASARHTGRNINEQLKKFKEMKSDTEVMMIVQGNNRFDMAKWAEWAYDEVEDDLKDHIYGIAMADTCIGNGILETVEMCAAIPMMNIPEKIKKNIHFLGVGTITRLIPIIELSRTTLFEDCNISFDATTHSNCMILGNFTNEKGRKVRMGMGANRENLKFFKVIYDEISKYYEHEVTFDQYIQHVTSNFNTSTHLSNFEDRPMAILSNLTYWFVTLVSAMRFMDNIVQCQKDPMHYYKIMSKQNLRAIKPLQQLAFVNSVDEFEAWFRKYAKYVASARIPRAENGADGYSINTLF